MGSPVLVRSTTRFNQKHISCGFKSVVSQHPYRLFYPLLAPVVTQPQCQPPPTPGQKLSELAMKLINRWLRNNLWLSPLHLAMPPVWPFCRETRRTYTSSPIHSCHTHLHSARAKIRTQCSAVYSSTPPRKAIIFVVRKIELLTFNVQCGFRRSPREHTKYEEEAILL